MLLIACANVAGLLLARASARRREIGLRLAVGASRARLLRQLLVESLLLSLLGVAGGVALAWGLLQVLGGIRAAILIPIEVDLALNGRVVGLSVAMAALAGIGAGLAPACTATRRSVLAEMSGETPPRSLGGRWWSLRQALVTLQVAVSLVLLVMAGLLARNLLVTSSLDPGFPAANVASVTVGLGLSGYDEDDAERFLELARERVRALPGVAAVGQASRAPLSVNYARTGITRIDDQADAAAAVPTELVRIGAGYFEALGVPLLEGRIFDEVTDTSTSPPVAIVTRAFAARFWPDRSAVGQRVRVGNDERDVEIVGVVSDYKVRFLREPPTPYFHLPTAQQSLGMGLNASVLLARSEEGAGAGAALGELIQRELRAIDSGRGLLGRAVAR